MSLQLCSNDNDTYTTGYYTKYANYWYSRPRAAVECQQDGIDITSENNFTINPCNVGLFFMHILLVTCTMEGATRLVGGSTKREGRVEVCHDGYWGTVCSNSWTEEDAYVACRQTGGKGISRYK